MDNQPTDPVALELLITGKIRLEFLRDELPELLQDFPLVIRSGVYHHRDGHILFDQ